MTADDLLKLINDTEAALNLNKALYSSPGLAHYRDLLARLKTDKFMQDSFCKLFGVDPLKLPEMFSAADRALLIEDNVVENLTDKYEGILEKVKARPAMLWAISKMLG
jgi:hypothetical protein